MGSTEVVNRLLNSVVVKAAEVANPLVETLLAQKALFQAEPESLFKPGNRYNQQTRRLY